MAPSRDPQKRQSSSTRVNAALPNFPDPGSQLESDKRASFGTVRRKRTYEDIRGPLKHAVDGKGVDETGTRHEDLLHHSKRSRNTQRPLDDTSSAGRMATDNRNSSRVSPSSRPKHQKLPSNSSSRFLEGSMNDKPSNQPPSVYIGDEHLVDQYLEGREGGNVTLSEDMDITYDAGIQSTRPSSMYRFGKALVNAFNPVMVWHGIHDMWKDKSDEEHSQEKMMLHERQIKAELAYAALKKEGYPGTQRLSSLDTSKLQETDGASERRRDSAIDVDSYRSSTERKRDGVMFDSNSTLKVPAPALENLRSSTPLSEAHSGAKSSLHLRKPSFASLKKVKSHLQLPASKRQSTSPATIPSIESDSATSSAEPNALKKQISKKDLRKQLKLTKKVSDLETQLEKARRELQEATQQIPPVPPLPSVGMLRPFIPGALASLPSERLLSEHLSDTPPPLPNATNLAIEKAIGTREDDVEIVGPRKRRATTPAPGKSEKNIVPDPKTGSTKKRKSGGSDDLMYKPDSEDDDDSVSTKATKAHRRKQHGRPPKAQKAEPNSSPGTPRGTQKSKTGVTSTEDDPGKRILSNSSDFSFPFDSAKVDQAKILSMRSNPDSNVPFMKLSDDVTNLKKEFPRITNEQVVRYISTLLNDDNKPPPRTSSRQTNPLVSGGEPAPYPQHKAQRHPPIMGRPRSLSPIKPPPRAHKPLSPPPSRDYSKQAELRLGNPTGKAEDEVITISPAKDKNVPPVPPVPRELEGRRVEIKALKELEGQTVGSKPVEGKEEWKWDDDVF